SNDGTTASTPWLTWAHAFENTNCGDTLMVMDGTYTATHGSMTLTKSCTAAAPYTVRAQNERQAFIAGDGSWVPLQVVASSYVVIEGLRARSADKDPAAGGVNLGVMNVYTSNHVTLRRCLASHPNRYRNAGHVVQMYQSQHVLVEECEVYSFHRHGIYFGGGTSDSVARRNYCNPRDYPDIPGAENSGSPPGGDDCVLVYPGSNNIIENNIAEGPHLTKGFAVEALGAAVGNQFLGNVSLNAVIGIALDARGASVEYMPRDTTVKDLVVVGAKTAGVRVDGNKNFVCRNCSVFDASGGVGDGFDIDRLTAQPGDGNYSAHIYDSLALNNAGRGFHVAAAVQTWSAVNVNAFGNAPEYSPASNPHYDPLDTPLSTDPGLGTCRLWVPVGSPMKGAGQNGGDIGATVLYRYENGALGTEPLWDPKTGKFPCGATVEGVNDMAGSCFDVHERLNVGKNACAFPVGYDPGTGGSGAGGSGAGGSAGAIGSGGAGGGAGESGVAGAAGTASSGGSSGAGPRGSASGGAGSAGATPAASSDDSGCGCRTTGGAGDRSWAILMALGLIARRRR
ncbi:MAG: right-handed parallel beta-helix repeat-containing protein, partial [Polyangiaceae bacterium]